MAGHSKWAQIKHKKAHTDAKKGKIFSKIVKEITVAVRLGGKDPEANPRLRLAIERAKEVNMPSENIKRAIMKGTGELPGTTYEDVSYEGYGPQGVAILIKALTDNKNRTVSEIRHILTKNNGTLGEAGCVSWMFQQKGYILVDKTKINEDSLLGIALEAGAEDLINDPKEEYYEIITSPESFGKVRRFFEEQNIPIVLAEITMLPKNYITVHGEAAEQLLKLIEALEDNEDVQNVYSNFDISDDTISKLN
ncbi:MAG: YebC/PmpR family DNA-binding transcriptional regulator [Thermodesulfovibrionales bacterium]|nr:YebC/PmpR family DNA-binding transcriptional regulator [Thermodesulfovibrionales bacterium]